MAENPNTTASVSKPFQKRFLFSLLPSLFAAIIMTGIKMAEWLSGSSFAFLGLRPREVKGLTGILFFPFLHSDGVHLISNLFPFIFLTTLIYNLVPKIFWKVFGFTFLLSGFWTWCFARPGIVIGASGWVYALLGFLLIAGFARLGRKTMVIAGGLAFLYGGMVYGLVPIEKHISWEGHLMGLFAGSMAAFYWKKELQEVEDNDYRIPTPSGPEQEPPYPFWLYPFPHVVDMNKNVIPPDRLIWENGSPRIKTEEEINLEKMEKEDPNPPQKTNNRSGITDGYWTYHIS